MRILIYKDLGADPCSVLSLMSALVQENLDHDYELAYVDRHVLRSSDWQKDVALLIFPGGRDIPYHRALKGGANDQIVDFVHRGGNYLGICAGGYYGASQIEFEVGNTLEVKDSRELKFFPGIARGPAYGLGEFCYKSEQGSRMASLAIKDIEDLWASYYKGGCSFLDVEKFPNIDVIARYSDIHGSPAAIIQCNCGLGRAVLSGVHPEYSGHFPIVETSVSEPLLSTLKACELSRRKLFRIILESVLRFKVNMTRIDNADFRFT